jgi:hypothetical protein
VAESPLSSPLSVACAVCAAAGDYTARARHDDKIFQANFSVEAGVNHDVEVLAE